MPRHARIIRADATYHVTHRGNNREPIFLEVSDYHYYLELLKVAQKKYPFELFHYVLMPNHVHLILRSSTSETISPVLKWVAQAYSVHFNAAYGKSGHLWGDRFFSKEIDNDNYLLTAGIYVELNPIRAGITTDPKKYPWSSHIFYARNAQSALLRHSPAFTSLHPNPDLRRTAYAKLAEMWTNIRNFPS